MGPSDPIDIPTPAAAAPDPAAVRAMAHLAAVVESADDAIVSKDLGGIIQSWNPGAERLFGYPAGEIVGTPVLRLLPPGREAEEADILARVSRGERVPWFESVRVRKDGSLVPVCLTVSPIKGHGGAVVGASKIARDITDRRTLAAQEVLIAELRRALAEVKALRGLIPICAWCKMVRDDRAYWHTVEDFVAARTGARFTHGMCPGCSDRAHAEIAGEGVGGRAAGGWPAP